MQNLGEQISCIMGDVQVAYCQLRQCRTDTEVNVLLEMPYNGLHKKNGEKPIFVIYGTSYHMYY